MRAASLRIWCGNFILTILTWICLKQKTARSKWFASSFRLVCCPHVHCHICAYTVLYTNIYVDNEYEHYLFCCFLIQDLVIRSKELQNSRVSNWTCYWAIRQPVSLLQFGKPCIEDPSSVIAFIYLKKNGKIVYFLAFDM